MLFINYFKLFQWFYCHNIHQRPLVASDRVSKMKKIKPFSFDALHKQGLSSKHMVFFHQSAWIDPLCLTDVAFPLLVSTQYKTVVPAECRPLIGWDVKKQTSREGGSFTLPFLKTRARRTVCRLTRGFSRSLAAPPIMSIRWSSSHNNCLELISFIVKLVPGILERPSLHQMLKHPATICSCPGERRATESLIKLEVSDCWSYCSISCY